MALDTSTDELFSSADVAAKKRIYPTAAGSKKFFTGSGTLAAGIMVAYDTANTGWVPWTSGGANGTGTCVGLLWPDALVLDASFEKLATVMLRGQAHRDDIELNGESQANVDTQLQTGLRSIGIDIQGLEHVR